MAGTHSAAATNAVVTEPIPSIANDVSEEKTTVGDRPSAFDNEKVNHDVFADTKDESSPQETMEEEVEYPHGMKLVLIMSSLFLAMFLVALVSVSPLMLILTGTDLKSRIEQSSPLPYLKLRMTSTPWSILDGTEAPTCSPAVLFNSGSAKSTHSTTPKRFYLLPSDSSKLDQRSVVPLQTLSVSSSVVLLLVWGQLVSSLVSSS